MYLWDDIIWWQFIIVSEIQSCVCIFFFNSVVIWKQLCCQGQKNFSSDKQYKKTHNEKFGKWCERVRLISRLWWLHGFGYLWAHLNLAWWLFPPPPPPSPSRCALWKTQGGAGAQSQAIPPGSCSWVSANYTNQEQMCWGQAPHIYSKMCFL